MSLLTQSYALVPGNIEGYALNGGFHYTQNISHTPPRCAPMQSERFVQCDRYVDGIWNNLADTAVGGLHRQKRYYVAMFVQGHAAFAQAEEDVAAIREAGILSQVACEMQMPGPFYNGPLHHYVTSRAQHHGTGIYRSFVTAWNESEPGVDPESLLRFVVIADPAKLAEAGGVSPLEAKQAQVEFLVQRLKEQMASMRLIGGGSPRESQPYQKRQAVLRLAMEWGV